MGGTSRILPFSSASVRRSGFNNCPTLLNIRLGCFHLEFRAPSGSYSNNLGGIYSANGVDTHFQYCKFFGKQMSGNKYAEMHCCKKSPWIVCLNRCFLVRVQITALQIIPVSSMPNLICYIYPCGRAGSLFL